MEAPLPILEPASSNEPLRLTRLVYMGLRLAHAAHIGLTEDELWAFIQGVSKVEQAIAELAAMVDGETGPEIHDVVQLLKPDACDASE